MQARWLVSLMLLCTTLAGVTAGQTATAPALTIQNRRIRISCNAEKGTFRAEQEGTTFLESTTFNDTTALQAITLSTIHDCLGPAQSLAFEYASGRTYHIMLYDDLPFICFSVEFHNPTSKVLEIDECIPVRLPTQPGVPNTNLRILGCDGLTPATEKRISYTFLAVADPQENAGMVCGWLTHNRASGIVGCSPESDRLIIEPESEYGGLPLAPHTRIKGETFAVGFFDDIHQGLEDYADAIARNYRIELPPTPAGYCTWYSRPHGGASDQQHMAEMAEFCAEHLKPFGFEVLQIDDKWQISGRDFTTHKPQGPYPDGMKKTAQKIASAGLTSGLWLIPFGWDHTRDIFREHQDWFVHREADGSPYEVHWAGTCMDMTHPEARAFLQGVLRRITHQWGYKYLKIDGLWTGMAVKILYPEPTYRDDNLGDAVFHNPDKTNVEAYRDGLRLLRDAAGDDVYVLGCNIAQNMRTLGGSMGLVDGMRVGRDIGADWKRIIPCVEMGSRLYFLHDRVWHNDPDCLMLREPMTLEQARAWGSWIGISGQLNMVSEWLPGLPAERLDIVKRTMPNHGLCARPVDLFESEVPRVWHLKADEGRNRQDVVGLFNWDAQNPTDVRANLERLQLPDAPDGNYVGFDYWANRFIGPFQDHLAVELSPGSCKVISIRPVLDRPILLSTSRHVTHGIIDTRKIKWDPDTQTLAGRSKVVGGDPYQLRILAPDGKWSFQRVELSTESRQAVPTKSVDTHGARIRLTISSSTNQKVGWRIHFAKGDQ